MLDAVDHDGVAIGILAVENSVIPDTVFEEIAQFSFQREFRNLIIVAC